MNTNAPQTSIELIDKYGEKVTNMLQQLADNIGVSIDKFWPLFIKQQVIEGYLSVSIWTVVTLSSLICLYVNRESLKEGEEFNIRFCLVILSGIFLFFCIPALFIEVVPAIQKIFNPEYFAIKEVMKMIK